MGQEAVRWCTAVALSVAALLAGCGGGSAVPRGVSDGRSAYDGLEAAGVLELAPPRPDWSQRNGYVLLDWSDDGTLATYSVWLSRRAGAKFEEIAATFAGRTALIAPGPSWTIDFPTALVRVRGCDAAGACSDSNAQPLGAMLVESRPSLIPPIDPRTSTAGGSSAFVITDDGTTIAALRSTDMGMYGSAAEAFSPARVDIYTGPGQPVGLATPQYTGVTWSMAMSGDGHTLAIPLVYSFGGYATPGVSGVVVVYTRQPVEDGWSAWRLQAVIAPPPSLGIYEGLGVQLALSDDGRRLAALSWHGPQMGTGGPPVMVFDRDASERWQYRHSVPASSESRLALSGDGKTLAVTQPVDDAIGVQVWHLGCACGESVWQPQALLRSDEPGRADEFGRAGLAISDDGRTIAVGAPRGSTATQPGAIHVFRTDAGRWQRAARLVNAGETGSDLFGLHLALSGDGRVLAGSACGRFVESAGVNRNYAPPPAPVDAEPCHPSGADGLRHGAQVFRRDDAGAWHAAASVVPVLPPRLGGERIGNWKTWLVPLLSRDGATLALGVYRDADPNDGRPGETSLFVY